MRKLLIYFGNFYIPTIEQLSFHIHCVHILGSMEFGKTRNNDFQVNVVKNNLKLKKDYAEKII